MKYIFFNDSGLIRSGWRAAAFLVSFALLATVLIVGAVAVLLMLPIGPTPGSYLPIVIPFAISAVVAIILGWLYGKLFEGMPFRALGCSFRGGWLGHFALGCLVGAVALASAILVAVMSGGMSLAVNRDSAGSAISTTLLTTFVIFFVGALSEETLFRGYLLQTFTRSKLIPTGIVLTSLLFAFSHNANPAVGTLALVNTFIAGIWFAAAYLKTRDLWFPLGMHLMWNWLQGPVFGINVSGIAEFSPDPVLRATDVGPAWLTGGSYGIEGGAACTFALIISMALIYFLPNPKPAEEMLALSSPPAKP